MCVCGLYEIKFFFKFILCDLHEGWRGLLKVKASLEILVVSIKGWNIRN